MTKFESTYNRLCDRLAKGQWLKDNAERFKDVFESVEDDLKSVTLYESGHIICTVRSYSAFVAIQNLLNEEFVPFDAGIAKGRYDAVIEGVEVTLYVLESQIGSTHPSVEEVIQELQDK